MKTLPVGPVCALVGPTASGKSALGLAASERLGLELVCVDSVQAVRGFDIGSAKPTLAERARVPHHLVDVASWQAPLDASQWAARARAAIADARARGRCVLLVGGTGLYLRALICGLIDVPRDDALRAELLAREAREPHSLWQELLERDPATAHHLKPNNIAHVLRALEVTLLAGEPASALRARHQHSASPEPVHLLALDRPDAVLRARIAARSQRMLEQGLVGEVEGLLQQGVDARCQPMRAIGYRQIVEALAANTAHDVEALATQISAATWQYVRRQRTWLRRENRQRPVTPLLWGEEPAQEVLGRLCSWLAAR